MIFLNSLFGYLSLLIIVKWCTGSQADLYHVMIYMFLSPTDELGENQLFWGQRPLQVWVWFFSSLLVKKICYVCWLFICLNYRSWCADCVIAFGYNCSSMDALSKAFYTKEASYWGATFTSLLYDLLARKFRILFDHASILHLHHVYICLWFEFPLFDWVSARVDECQFSFRTITRSTLFQMNMLKC